MTAALTPPHLRDEDFVRARDYLGRLAGLAFAANRRAGLAAVLGERLRATGQPDVASYLSHVQSPCGERERQRLLDAVTVQETHFFRNTPQMAALRQVVLPDLLARAAERGRPLTVWSAGCSTGEEAYSLAMLLIATDGSGTPPARVLATDVSAAALGTASRATYAGRTLAAVPADLRQRFFRPAGAAGDPGALVVRDEVRALVDLAAHNLVTDPPPFEPGSVDLVVCRNVTIYFARATTRALVDRFHDVLSPDGYLLLGHAESLWQLNDSFRLQPVGEAFVYRPAGSPAVVPVTIPRRPGWRDRSAPAPASVDVRGVMDPLDGARAALLVGDYAQAERLAEAACTAAPLVAEAYVVLGHARTTLARDAAALEALRKAVFLDPTHGIAYFLIGGALARLGQHALAAVAYRAAAETLPGTPRAVLATYLGGRAVADLVGVCERLAVASAGLAVGEAGVTVGRTGS